MEILRINSQGGDVMLMKMKESKGFTLVELMIVVAIIGILAAVAVPYYQRYVAKSRLTSLVMPSVHAVETNISTYFAVRATMPALSTDIDKYVGDADTYWVTFGGVADNYEVTVTVHTENADPNDGNRFPLKALGTEASGKANFRAIANKSSDGNKLYWSYQGTLADELGL
jgi:type IV pilus assembly protein PilA